MAFSSILVRPAEASDRTRSIEIGSASCLHLMAGSGEFSGKQIMVPGAVAGWYDAHDGRILIAERDGIVVGWSATDQATGEIADLWVDPAHHGQGIGAILLAAAEAQIKQDGHSCSWLTSHRRNLQTLGFYRVNGYTLLAAQEAQAESFGGASFQQALLGKQLRRPDAQKADTMADVRVGIDTLDPMLVALVAERFAFIDRAADLKPALAMPARVNERVEEVVSNARAQAENIGFDPDLTERLWRTMIDLAIEREEVVMAATRQERAS